MLEIKAKEHLSRIVLDKGKETKPLLGLFSKGNIKKKGVSVKPVEPKNLNQIKQIEIVHTLDCIIKVKEIQSVIVLCSK